MPEDKSSGDTSSDDDTHPGMAKPEPLVHGPVHGPRSPGVFTGPRSIGALVPAVARTAFQRSGLGVAQLMEAWTGIVGPTLAEATTPRRLSQGTLTIGCSGPMAMELQHLATELIDRINQYLGTSTVRRLRFVQILGTRPSVRTRTPPTADVERAASDAVANIPEGPLRDALAQLGRAVLSKSPPGKSARRISPPTTPPLGTSPPGASPFEAPAPATPPPGGSPPGASPLGASPPGGSPPGASQPVARPLGSPQIGPSPDRPTTESPSRLGQQPRTRY